MRTEEEIRIKLDKVKDEGIGNKIMIEGYIDALKWVLGIK